MLPIAILWQLRGIVNAVVHVGAAEVNPHLLAWAGLSVLAAAVGALKGWVSEQQTQAVAMQVQEIVEARSIAMDLSYYDNADFHDAVFRAQQQAGWRSAQVAAALVGLAGGSLLSLSLVAVLVARAPMVALFTALAWLPGTALRLVQARRSFARNEAMTPIERRAHYLHTLMAGVDAAREVHLFGLGPVLLDRARQTRQELCGIKVRGALEAGLADTAIAVLTTVGATASLGWLAWLTAGGRITAGDLVMLLGVLQQGQGALKTCQKSVGTLTENGLFLRSLRSFLLLPASRHEPAAPVEPPPLADGIRFEKVSFRYPQSERWALRDVDVELPAGARVALVGENGSGKSTLVKLLCRLYDPERGRLTWDGTDVLDCRREALQARMTAVFQDPMRFQLSVAENVWLGNVALALTDPRIGETVRAAGLEPVIAGLPKGIQTCLGRVLFQGEELSAGQWQRLSLARAWLRDADLVVLDEPTSSLDAEAEADVLGRFLDLARGKTTLFVSHRLSTVRHADRIYVLSGGAVIEQGTHDALMARGGVYARMFEKQARPYRSPADALSGT